MDLILSICIPAYNFDIRPLIKALSKEIKTSHLPVEMIVVDDASHKSFHLGPEFIQKHSLNYEILDQNIGRSKIRNYLAQKASAPYLLFMDGDSLVHHVNYINNYLDAIESYNVDLICGGRVYPEICLGKEQFLSWNYGVKVESTPANVRNQNPFDGFMTNNFVVKQTIMQAVPFDENLIGYGHEDTLFGQAIQEAGFKILHIDNPVLNGHIEDNTSFIQKTEEGIRNMLYILDHRPTLANAFKLNRFYLNKSPFFHGLMGFLGRLFLTQLIKKVLQRRGTLFLFQWYKYLYFLKLKKA